MLNVHSIVCSNGGEEVTRKMETKRKMAIAGSGLVVAGVGLGILGAALIVPAVFEWTFALSRKRRGRSCGQG